MNYTVTQSAFESEYIDYVVTRTAVTEDGAVVADVEVVSSTDGDAEGFIKDKFLASFVVGRPSLKHHCVTVRPVLPAKGVVVNDLLVWAKGAYRLLYGMVKTRSTDLGNIYMHLIDAPSELKK